MLETVDVGKQHLSLYESSAGIEAVSQLRELAEPLRGARVLHVNATPYGGGVAEILRSEIPLLRDLGLAGEERDPVCGMRVDPHKAWEYVYRGHPYHFCSESCREQFRATPEHFLRATVYSS